MKSGGLKAHIIETIGKSTNSERGVIVNKILEDKTPFSDLLDILLLPPPISTRFSWLLGSLSECESTFLGEILPFIVENKTHIQVSDINRVLAKQCYICSPNLPENLEGQLIDDLFGYLMDKGETISTKDYAMKALQKITAKYPDLKPELITVLNSLIESHSGGIKKRAEKLKAQL